MSETESTTEVTQTSDAVMIDAPGTQEKTMRLIYTTPPAGTTITCRDDGWWCIAHTSVDQVWLDAVGQPAPTCGTNVICSSGPIYPNESMAHKVAVDTANIRAALALVEAAGISPPYGREEYERACALIEVDPMTDAEIDRWGGWGVFDPPQYSPEVCVRMTLAARRLDQLTAERTAQPEPNEELVATGSCDKCGTTIYNNDGMIASRGLACSVDCYDELEG